MEEGAMPKLTHLTLVQCEKMSKLPEGLLHLPSLGHLILSFMSQISEDDNTRKELLRKGYEVKRTWNPYLIWGYREIISRSFPS